MTNWWAFYWASVGGMDASLRGIYARLCACSARQTQVVRFCVGALCRCFTARLAHMAIRLFSMTNTRQHELAILFRAITDVGYVLMLGGHLHCVCCAALRCDMTVLLGFFCVLVVAALSAPAHRCGALWKCVTPAACLRQQTRDHSSLHRSETGNRFRRR